MARLALHCFAILVVAFRSLVNRIEISMWSPTTTDNFGCPFFCAVLTLAKAYLRRLHDVGRSLWMQASCLHHYITLPLVVCKFSITSPMATTALLNRVTRIIVYLLLDLRSAPKVSALAQTTLDHHAHLSTL